jgi:hypothetical protein
MRTNARGGKVHYPPLNVQQQQSALAATANNNNDMFVASNALWERSGSGATVAYDVVDVAPQHPVAAVQYAAVSPPPVANAAANVPASPYSSASCGALSGAESSRAVSSFLDEGLRYGKESVQHRIPRTQRKAEVPGYTGHSHALEFLGGSTYGRGTLRAATEPQCLASPRFVEPNFVVNW